MLKWLVRAVMLLEDKSICDGNIEEEVENILVKFPASSPTAIVPSPATSSIYTTHVLVIAHDGSWACYCDPANILLPS